MNNLICCLLDDKYIKIDDSVNLESIKDKDKYNDYAIHLKGKFTEDYLHSFAEHFPEVKELHFCNKIGLYVVCSGYRK
ncbi:MAG: hypothetical protein ACK5L5_04495 [Bacteroidales bacterium]